MERNPEVYAQEALSRSAKAVAQTDHHLLFEVSMRKLTGFSPFHLLYGRSVRGPGTILKELWAKEVNIPEIKTSYECVMDLSHRLKDSLKLAQEELQKSQKRYKRQIHNNAKTRRLDV